MFVVAHNGARIWGGAERATALLLAGLAARGHRVLLLCNDERVARGAAELGVPTEILRIRGNLVLSDAVRLALRLRRDRPDAFVIGTFNKLPLASLGARLAGVPRVVARIGLERHLPRTPKYRVALRRFVHAVVVNASHMRPAFLALPGWSESRVRVIHNGIRAPERTTPPGTLRRSLGIPDDAPVFGSLARLAPQKRLDRMVRVLAALPAAHCVIAGEGPRRAALERLAADAGVAGRLHLLGYRSDTGDVLDALDLYVVSSDHEGMSNGMLEAMAFGLPVVSTDVSGAREALEPLPGGVAPGVVVDREDRSLAQAVGAALGAPERLAEMGAAARAVAAARFSVEGSIDEWERILRAEAAP